MAFKYVNEAIKQVINDQQEISAEILQLELMRLDSVFEVFYTKVKNGDPIALDRMIKIMERRSKYLSLESCNQILTEAEKQKSFSQAFCEAIEQVEKEEEALRSKNIQNNELCP